MIIGQNYPFFHLPKLLTIQTKNIGLGLGWAKGNISSKGVSTRTIYSKDGRISTIHSEKTFKPVPIWAHPYAPPTKQKRPIKTDTHTWIEHTHMPDSLKTQNTWNGCSPNLIKITTKGQLTKKKNLIISSCPVNHIHEENLKWLNPDMGIIRIHQKRSKLSKNEQNPPPKISR